MNRRIRGLRNNGFLNRTKSKIISRKTPPPQRNPNVALPSVLAMNQEKAMTRKSRKKSNIKLINAIKISILRVLERLLTEVSLNNCTLVSRYSVSSFRFSW
jgi:hypothetical protein